MKIDYRRTTYIFAIAFVLTLGMTAVVLAGSGDSPAGPTEAGSQMYTLEQIYDQLATGSAGTKMTTFTEPVSAPGTGTMYTLDEIMAAIPEVSASGAVSTEVRADKTFWGLNAGEWGSQTGKLYGGCHCEGGTLNGTRWCDNDDGTITDLLGYNGVGQCLVWQKDADCNTLLAGINKTDNLDWADAVVWSSAIQSGVCSLTDSSVEGDWRLPTKEELYALLHGTEAVSLASPRAFTNISVTFYWSSTTYANNNTYAWAARPYDAFMYSGSKLSQSFDVLPVRGGQ